MDKVALAVKERDHKVSSSTNHEERRNASDMSGPCHCIGAMLPGSCVNEVVSAAPHNENTIACSIAPAQAGGQLIR